MHLQDFTSRDSTLENNQTFSAPDGCKSQSLAGQLSSLQELQRRPMLGFTILGNQYVLLARKSLQGMRDPGRT